VGWDVADNDFVDWQTPAPAPHASACGAAYEATPASDPGRFSRLMDRTVDLPGRDRIGGTARWEQPPVRQHDAAPLASLPPQPQQCEQLGWQHGVAVLAALPLFDPDQHARAVDIIDLEAGHFRHAQASAIGGAGYGLVFDARCRLSLVVWELRLSICNPPKKVGRQFDGVRLGVCLIIKAGNWHRTESALLAVAADFPRFLFALLPTHPIRCIVVAQQRCKPLPPAAIRQSLAAWYRIRPGSSARPPHLFGIIICAGRRQNHFWCHTRDRQSSCYRIVTCTQTGFGC
jgi:hypothetical protein